MWFAADSIYWTQSKDGVYSVKSGYRALTDTRITTPSLPSTSTSIPTELWGLIWASKVPTKVKHFVWKARHNILPSRENLNKKRIPITKQCPVCNTDSKTIEHIFLLCPWTKPLWFELQFIPPPSEIGLSTLHQWILDSIETHQQNTP